MSSEDEVAGLEPEPRVARHSFGGSASAEVPAPKLHPAGDEVLVKKRALKWVKQQVSALLCGEDLPQSAETGEVAEVLYQIPDIPREAKDCPDAQ